MKMHIAISPQWKDDARSLKLENLLISQLSCNQIIIIIYDISISIGWTSIFTCCRTKTIYSIYSSKNSHIYACTQTNSIVLIYTSFIIPLTSNVVYLKIIKFKETHTCGVFVYAPYILFLSKPHFTFLSWIC